MAAFKSIKRLKADARASLLGNLITPVISVLLYLATTAVLTELIANFRTGSVLLSLLLSVIVFLVVNICAKMLRIGLCCIFLRLQLRKGARISDLFYGFRNSSDTAVKISTHLALLELLCMMPLFIALSVLSAKGISGHRGVLLFLFAAGSCASFFFRIYYALSPYLFLDFPGLSARSLLSGSGSACRRGRRRAVGKQLLAGRRSRLLSGSYYEDPCERQKVSQKRTASQPQKNALPERSAFFMQCFWYGFKASQRVCSFGSFSASLSGRSACLLCSGSSERITILGPPLPST